MHGSASLAGLIFYQTYCKMGMKVVDVGGMDVNGSLRGFFADCEFISVDMSPGKGVDIVVKPGEPLPFEDGSVDAVVSTSCFEHDPCFWMTFREMCRIVKVGGFIYINAPSGGVYHGYPGDNWRFFADAGFALAVWSSANVGGTSYPAEVVETLIIDGIPNCDCFWKDWVCIWRRTEVPQTEITNPAIKAFTGPFKAALNTYR